MRGPNHYNGFGRPHLQGRPNRSPLRRIVERFENSYGVEMERLECGHAVIRRSDMIGPTSAERRRCDDCGSVPPAGGTAG